MASTHDYIADKRNKDILIYINGEFFIDQMQKFQCLIVAFF